MSCSQADWSRASRSLQCRPRREPSYDVRLLTYRCQEPWPKMIPMSNRAPLARLSCRRNGVMTMTASNIRALLPALAAPAALLAALIGVSGCRSEATPDAQAPAPQVSVASALERNVTEWDEFTGRLEAVESVEVRPRVTGYIESVNFTEGSTVRKGDPLFVIDPRPYRAELSKAEAELARAVARAELAVADEARSEKLLDIKAVSREEYDSRVNGSREAKGDG